MKGMKHKRVRWSKEDGSGRGYEQQEMGLYRRFRVLVRLQNELCHPSAALLSQVVQGSATGFLEGKRD